MGDLPAITLPTSISIDDALVIKPPADRASVTIRRGPNIKPLPQQTPLPSAINGEVLLKVGDNITTDHIMPAGAKVLQLRSNIPAISEFVYVRVDPEFPKRAKEKGGGIIVGGEVKRKTNFFNKPGEHHIGGVWKHLDLPDLAFN